MTCAQGFGHPQACQGAEQGAVGPGQCWPGVGAAQHGDLVAQDQDLGVLGGVGAGEQCQPAQREKSSGRRVREPQRAIMLALVGAVALRSTFGEGAAQGQ